VTALELSVVVGRGYFGNAGRRTSAVGSRYPSTSEEQQTKNTQCACHDEL
jgi:hypothetical protein